MSAFVHPRAEAHPAVPRAPLIGAFALIVVTLAMVALARVYGIESVTEPAAAVSTRDLRFEDRADGTIAVFDARDGATVTVVAAGTNGFLRATLRGLVRERRQQGGDRDVPFRLAERADGRLTLEDPVTGRRVNLEAFGSTNAAAFARLLPDHDPKGTSR